MQTDNWLNYKPYSFDYGHKLNISPFKPSHTGGLTLNNMKCWRNSKLKMFIILKHYRIILQNILMQKRVLWIILEPLYSGTPVFWNPFWNPCILEPLYFGNPVFWNPFIFCNPSILETLYSGTSVFSWNPCILEHLYSGTPIIMDPRLHCKPFFLEPPVFWNPLYSWTHVFWNPPCILEPRNEKWLFIPLD